MTAAEFELLVIAQDASHAGRSIALVLDGAEAWMDPSRLLAAGPSAAEQRAAMILAVFRREFGSELDRYDALVAAWVAAWVSSSSSDQLDTWASIVGVSRR